MACLLKVLSDMLQSPPPLSHFHICPKPKVKLGPTNLIYPAPLSLFDIATARNPNQFGLTDGISVSPRWACKLSDCLLQLFRSHRDMQSVPPSLLDQLSVCSLPKSVSPSLCNWSNRVEVLPEP